MHLLSHNGPIDVLVCPEVEEGSAVPKINTTHDQKDSSSCRDLDISLSSIASAPDENASNGTMDTFPDLLAQSLPGVISDSKIESCSNDMFLPVDMFESLSPPCNNDEFYPTLSPSEGILELFDLA